MARDGMTPIQVKKTQAGAATNTATWSFTFSGDLHGCKVFEMRHLTVGHEDVAGSVSANAFTAYVIIITQGSVKFVFYGDRYNISPNGLVWPDGCELNVADGDTVTVTMNCALAGNANTRHLFIRGLIRGY